MLQSVTEQVRDDRVAALIELAVFPDPEPVEPDLAFY